MTGLLVAVAALLVACAAFVGPERPPAVPMRLSGGGGPPPQGRPAAPRDA